MTLPYKRAGASQFDTNGRTRAISTSQIQTEPAHILPRKTSSLSTRTSIPISRKRSVQGPSPLDLSGKPNRARRIGNMDLDDILNGSDDENSESLTLSNCKPPGPKLSQSARDLIDFLDTVPPPEFSPSASSSLKTGGRFQRMMSRLTGSSSSERLREEGARLKKTPVVNTAVVNAVTNHPQTPVRRAPAVIVATPPPRMQPIPQPATPPRSPIVIHDMVQRKTSVRKKVPPLDPQPETSVHSPPSPSISRTFFDEKTRPSVLPNRNGQPNGVNEVHKRTRPPLAAPESESRSRAGADSIVSDEKIIFLRPTPPQPTKITVEVSASPPTPLPVTIRPPSPSQDAKLSLNAAHARSLRQLMSTATSADECRVLVDMFLARVGFPIDRSTDADPYPSPISSTDPSDVDLENSVIETLLGGDCSSVPSTTVHSTQPSEAGQADESELGTSDAETCDELVDSPARRSPSDLIVRNGRVSRPLPPVNRLLAVA